MTIRVIDNDGKLMLGKFEVLGRSRSMAKVRSVQTGRTLTVHDSRIRGEQGPGEVDMATKKAKAKKVVGVSFDWKAVKGERWSKSIKFDHAGIKAEAHVLVDVKAKTYRTLNTYNGSLGSSGKLGTVFNFENYDELTIKLRKKDYAKKPVAKSTAKKATAPVSKPKPVVKPKPAAPKPVVAVPVAAPVQVQPPVVVPVQPPVVVPKP